MEKVNSFTEQEFEQRLRTMLVIRQSHSEEYYKQGAASKGMNIKELTHPQIAAWKATMDSIEADLFIEIAKTLPKSYVCDLNLPEEMLNSDPNPERSVATEAK